MSISSDLRERWESIGKDGEEYLEFGRVEKKRSSRPDLHAFLMLDELFPSHRDMVCAASHDEIYLDIEESQASSLTDEQILELIRCGVRFSNGSVCMFA